MICQHRQVNGSAQDQSGRVASSFKGLTRAMRKHTICDWCSKTFVALGLALKIFPDFPSRREKDMTIKLQQIMPLTHGNGGQWLKSNSLAYTLRGCISMQPEPRCLRSVDMAPSLLLPVPTANEVCGKRETSLARCTLTSNLREPADIIL